MLQGHCTNNNVACDDVSTKQPLREHDVEKALKSNIYKESLANTAGEIT